MLARNAGIDRNLGNAFFDDSCEISDLDEMLANC